MKVVLIPGDDVADAGPLGTRGLDGILEILPAHGQGLIDESRVDCHDVDDLQQIRERSIRPILGQLSAQKVVEVVMV